MSLSTSVLRLFWIVGIGLGLVAVVVALNLLPTNSRTSNEAPVQETIELIAVAPSPMPTTINPVEAIQWPAQLPVLDFPPGSVEQACRLNEFPGYFDYDEHDRKSWPNDPFNAEGDWKALDSNECRTALDAHINIINPYLWGETRIRQQFAFVVLENPLTFERIFANPMGDLVRLQDALSRPECLLEQGKEKNWELKENCHADAILNFALVNRFCFGGGIRNRNTTYYWEEDNPSPDQDRFMWKQALEGAWVEEKCEKFNPTLEFTEEHYPELYELVMSFDDREKKIPPKGSQALLIELAARLGDDAAGLTTRSFKNSSFVHTADGYKYGRFAEVLASASWQKLRRKDPPSVERFLQIFRLLAYIDSRKYIKFDWDWVAQHLCSPPYDDYVAFAEAKEDFAKFNLREADVVFPKKPPEPQSCQEVIHEIHQSQTDLTPLLDVIANFEQTALNLEVYD